MLWIFLLALLAIVLIPVAILVAKAIISKSNLKYYEKQGIKTFYFPVAGHFGFLNANLPENKKGSPEGYLKKVSNEIPEGILTVNTLASTSCMSLIFSSDLVKDFLLKEDQLEKLPYLQEMIPILGLFFENGEEAFKSKALFSKLFSYDGMEVFIPRISRIICNQFNKFITEHGMTTDKPTRINLNDLFEPIMTRIVLFIVFGEEDYAESSDEMAMHDSIFRIMEEIKSIRRNKHIIVFPTLSRLFRMVTPLDNIKKIMAGQEKIVRRIIDKRTARGGEYGQCILDRIIVHNRECKEKNNLGDYLDDLKIVGNMNLFVFAGSDTSQNGSKIALCHMADKPEIKSFIDSINAEIYDKDGMTSQELIDNNEKVIRWTKETLRRNSPVSLTGPRVILKDMQLKNYHLKKGDRVMIMLTGLNFNENFFPKPDELREERWTKENEKSLPRYQHIPFSVGKRVCLGRHLGELMLRLLVTQFCRHFEFNRPKDIQYYSEIFMVTKVANPIVLASVKPILQNK
jgi:cytochrome P450